MTRLGGGLPLSLDDDAVDAAVEPGGRGQPRRHLRPGSGARRQALRAGAGADVRPTRGNSVRNPRSWPPTPAGDLLETRYLPPFPYFMDAAELIPGTARRFRQHRGRHRHRAHGSRLWRRRHGDHPGGGHLGGDSGRSQGSLRWDRAGLRRPACVRRQPADHPRPEEPGPLGGRQRRGADAPRDLRALLPALLAVPKPVDLPGGVVVVHQGHRLPRPHGRAQQGHHLVPGARQGWSVRQVAFNAPGTGRSRETATGAHRFRCGSPTIRRIRASTCTAASTSSSATSVCARQICTGPTSTN